MSARAKKSSSSTTGGSGRGIGVGVTSRPTVVFAEARSDWRERLLLSLRALALEATSEADARARVSRAFFSMLFGVRMANSLSFEVRPVFIHRRVLGAVEAVSGIAKKESGSHRVCASSSKNLRRAHNPRF